MISAIEWLLEDDNPAVAYRTRAELLGERADAGAARERIFSFLPENRLEAKGLWRVYYLTALAECGVTREFLPDIAFDDIDFDGGCAGFMLLRALCMLGFSGEEFFGRALSEAKQLPDGGFLCARRLKTLSGAPKSCYKANLHALMLASEMKKRGEAPGFSAGICGYFLKRKVLFRSDLSALVYESKHGWGVADAFFPFEPMRVGLQNTLEALGCLGCGRDARTERAWELLRAKFSDGRVALEGTLTKSYLPRERVGKPSKWATFYALLAEKAR